jgi:hypothetical protein
MSKQQPHILYVGPEDLGRALDEAVEPMGWHVYHPATTMDALAQHISFFPDFVVIHDAGVPGWTSEAFFHLHSLKDGTPLLLTGEPQPGGIHVLPGIPTLVEVMEALVRNSEYQLSL